MSSDFDSSRIIFIGGAPRSGTTLVQRIIASHSLVFGGPEFDLIPAVMRLRNAFHDSVDSGRISVYLNNDDIDALFRGFVGATFQKIMQANPSKQYLSEKTPANAEVFEEIAATFPKAQLIFVVRDPRAIVASMIEVGERYRKEGLRPTGFTKNVRQAIRYINNLWCTATYALGRENVHVVFYEDIVLNPKVFIPDLANKLGLIFEEGMVQIEKQSTITAELKNAEHLWYSKEKLQSAIDNHSLGKWKNQLSTYELFIIDKRLKRIPGVTDRYQISQPPNLLFHMLDYWGNIILEAKEFIGKVGKKLYSRL